MGLFGTIGGIIGAGKAKKASKKAAKAQIAAMEKGIAEQRAGLTSIQGYYEPYRAGGEQAYGMYGNLVGLGGAEQQQAAIDQLKTSPFYESLYRQGEEAVLQNASATGGLRGGNTQRSLADFGADTLASTIDRQLSYLGGLSSMGYNSAGALSNATMGIGNNVTNLLTGQGQAKADDYLRRGALSQQIWNSIGSFGDSAMSAVMGGIGAGGGFGAMGAGGAPFNMGAAMNSMLGQPGLFGGGAGGAGNQIMVTGLPNAMPAGWGGI